MVTLSRWECDKVFPTTPHHSRIIEYLGYDPFADPAVKNTASNETIGVAILSSRKPGSLGEQITRRRIEMRKTQRECAKEMGVSVKSWRNWETGQRTPSPLLRKRLIESFGLL